MGSWISLERRLRTLMSNGLFTQRDASKGFNSAFDRRRIRNALVLLVEIIVTTVVFKTSTLFVRLTVSRIHVFGAMFKAHV